MHDVTQAAKAIRTVLKTEYPGIKFSVRVKRFSGGSSVDIDWTNGPTEQEIAFKTAQFKGYHNGYYNDYISPRRLVTRKVMVAAAKACAEHYGVDMPEVKGGPNNPYLASLVMVGGEPICDRVHRAAWSTSVYGVELEDAFVEAFPN